MDESGRSEILIKRYLLGNLPEPEMEVVEKRLLTDREFCEEVSMARTELLDEYLDAVLSPQERQQFEAHFLSTPRNFQRVEIARALANRLGEATGPQEFPVPQAKRFYLQHLMLFATLTAGLLLLAGLVVWQLAPSRPPDDQSRVAQQSIFRNELARINQSSGNSAQTAIPVVPLTLRPVLMRDVAENRSIMIPPNPSIIQLRLELLNDKYEGYKATLKTDEGVELGVIDRLPSLSVNNTKAVQLNLPSWLIKPGSYQVELSGRLPSNEHEQVNLYPFDIVNH